MKKILVTGGAGYIGAVLCGMLVERGYDVRVIDRLYWGAGPLERWKEHVEVIKGDVRSMSDSVLHGVDGVVHLAGLSNDPTAEYNPAANWEMNTVATKSLAEACKRAGIERLTFGSSCSLYDGLPAGQTYDEDSCLRPRGAYATSKKAAEEALMEVADDAFRPTILRQGTVYGYSPRMRFDLVVNTFVKDALQKGHLSLHGGGWMWRPLVDVTDVARAHIHCLEAPLDKVGGQLFNVFHDNYQIRELAMLVAGSAQMRKFTVDLKDAPLPEITRDYKCANTKFKQMGGFEPQVSVLESIEGMLQWIERDGPIDFAHPRYNNIAWMTLLEEANANLSGFPSVF
jgi:nucleoside-diphosphate-sugar epimerase